MLAWLAIRIHVPLTIIISLVFLYTSYFIKYKNVPLDSRDKVIVRLKCLSKMNFHWLYKYHNIIPCLFISSIIIELVQIFHLNPFYYLFLSLPVYMQYVIIKSRKAGQYAYSLTRGLDIGFINPKTVSLHLSKNNLWIMREVYRSKLLDLLKEIGVENIVFKSHLIHKETSGYKKKINFINKCMEAQSWKLCTEYSKETSMDNTTYLAIKIRIIHSQISVYYYGFCYYFFENDNMAEQLTLIKSSIPEAINKKEYQLCYSI